MTRTILITGASSGIGAAAAHLFHARGWNVVATMRKPEAGAELAQLERVLVTRLDLLDEDSIVAAVAAGTERFGSIDVLLNNAGYGAYGILEATPMDALRRQFEVNVFGLVAAIQAVLPQFRARKAGTIINVSSVGGRTTYPLGSLYHGSKWAVEGLSEALSFELSAIGVKVKLIEPGGVRTNFSGRSFEFTHDPELKEYAPTVDKLMAAQQAASQNPEHQEPEEVAELIFEAATDDSDRLRYISGEGAKVLLAARREGDEEQFLAGLRQRFGF